MAECRDMPSVPGIPAFACCDRVRGVRAFVTLRSALFGLAEDNQATGWDARRAYGETTIVETYTRDGNTMIVTQRKAVAFKTGEETTLLSTVSNPGGIICGNPAIGNINHLSPTHTTATGSAGACTYSLEQTLEAEHPALTAYADWLAILADIALPYPTHSCAGVPDPTGQGLVQLPTRGQTWDYDFNTGVLTLFSDDGPLQSCFGVTAFQGSQFRIAADALGATGLYSRRRFFTTMFKTYADYIDNEFWCRTQVQNTSGSPIIACERISGSTITQFPQLPPIESSRLIVGGTPASLLFGYCYPESETRGALVPPVPDCCFEVPPP